MTESCLDVLKWRNTYRRSKGAKMDFVSFLEKETTCVVKRHTLVTDLSSVLQNLSSYSGSRRGSNDSTESDVSRDSNDPKDQARKFKVNFII